MKHQRLATASEHNGYVRHTAHGTFIPRRKHRFPSAQRSQTAMGPISSEFGDALGTQGDVLYCFCKVSDLGDALA